MPIISRFGLDNTPQDNDTLLGSDRADQTRNYELVTLADYFRSNGGFDESGIAVRYQVVPDGTELVAGTASVTGYTTGTFNLADTTDGLSITIHDADSDGVLEAPLLAYLTGGGVVKVGAPPHGRQFKVYRLDTIARPAGSTDTFLLTLSEIPPANGVDTSTSTNVALALNEQILIVPISASATGGIGGQGEQGIGIDDITSTVPVKGQDTTVTVSLTDPSGATTPADETFMVASGVQGAAGIFDLEVYQLQDIGDSATTPTGGSYNSVTDTITPPTGWTDEVQDHTATQVVWESRVRINPQTYTDGDTITNWSVPFRAGGQGPTGSQGVQGIGIESVTGDNDAGTLGTNTVVTVSYDNPDGVAPGNDTFTVASGIQGASGFSISAQGTTNTGLGVANTLQIISDRPGTQDVIIPVNAGNRGEQGIPGVGTAGVSITGGSVPGIGSPNAGQLILTRDQSQADIIVSGIVAGNTLRATNPITVSGNNYVFHFLTGDGTPADATVAVPGGSSLIQQEAITEYSSTDTYSEGHIVIMTTGDDTGLYESLVNSNLGNAVTSTTHWGKLTAFVTDANITKLDNIEPMATADQTGAEIKIAYEGEADTNAFTDAEKIKLAATASQYSSTVEYGVNDVVFLPSGNDAGYYVSLVANNQGISVADTTRWTSIGRLLTNDQNSKINDIVFGTPIYSSTQTYEIGDTVRTVDSIYASLSASNLGNSINNATHWAKIASLITAIEQLDGIRPLDTTTGLFDSTTDTTFQYTNAPLDFKLNPTLHQLITVNNVSLGSNPIGVVSFGTDNTVTLASVPTGLTVGNNNLVFQRTVGISQLEISGITELTGEFSLLSDVFHAGNLPTTDPGVSGHWWNDGGTLVLSGSTATTGGDEYPSPTVNGVEYGSEQGLHIDSSTVEARATIPTTNTLGTTSIGVLGSYFITTTAANGHPAGLLRIEMNATNREDLWDIVIGGTYSPDAVGTNTDVVSTAGINILGVEVPRGTIYQFNNQRVLIVSTAFSGVTLPADDSDLVVTTIGRITFEFEDAQDWNSFDAYDINDVVNFRGGIFKRRNSVVTSPSLTSASVPGFSGVFYSKSSGLSGTDGVVAFYQFTGDAPDLGATTTYRFSIGSGPTGYVITALPSNTPAVDPETGEVAQGLQDSTASNSWQLRLTNNDGSIASGFTVVSAGEQTPVTTQQFLDAIAPLAGQQVLDGSQITSGTGIPNTSPYDDVSWEDISTPAFGPDRWNEITGETVRFDTIPDGETTVSDSRTDARRTTFEGVVGTTMEYPRTAITAPASDGTQLLTVESDEQAALFTEGSYVASSGSRFQGRIIVLVRPRGTAATNQVRFKIVYVVNDGGSSAVSGDNAVLAPGAGTLVGQGDALQVGILEDVNPIASIHEFDDTIVPNNSNAITLGTNFEPSAQVTYLTSFAPRENVEYNGNFYFYIGPGSHADFLHDAALRPQEFTNADFVPGNNKLNWVTYNEFINDISEADRSYSERIAATRDVTLHAQVRREIEAAKQDVLLTLSDRDSEREDQLVSLRPIWRLANTRYDDGSRFRRNVLYNAISTAPSYTLTAGNRENTRGYNVFGSTGTVTFNGIIATGEATVSGAVITILTPNGTALTQDQIATAEYSLAGRTINLLNRFGLVSYSASATSITFTYSSASLASFSHGEFLGAGGRLVIINTTQTTVNRKEASLCWVEFVEGSTRFTGEGLVTDGDGIIGRQELISALDTTSPEDNNGVVLGIENSDTTVHYFNSAKPWDDDFFTAQGDQAVHCTVSAGNTGVTGTTFNDTRVSALGAAQRFAWSTRTYEDNPEDYFDLDPSANEYIIDNYNFAARAGGLVITGALLEPAVKSYSGFVWIASNASNMSNEALHPQNRVVQTPFRNVNTIDLSQFQSVFNSTNALEAVAGVTQIQTLKMYGLTDTTIATINSGNRVDFRFTLNEPGTESTPIYQLSTVGTTPYRAATSEIDVTFVNTDEQGVEALSELSRFAWQLDARAAGTITRPTLATEAYTSADGSRNQVNITAGTAVQGAFLGPHGILTNEPRYFQDSTKQWAPTTNTAREFNNSLFSRGESINPDTVVRGSDGTYYKWAFRGVENRFGGSVVIRYDNVQVVRGSDGRFSSGSINPAPGDAGSVYDPASEDETVFDDEGTRTTDPIITLDNLNNLFQVNAVHPFTVEYDGYFNLAAGESATNASIIFGGTTTIGAGVTNFAELNRFVLMDPTALHAQATLVAGGSTNSQAIRDGHAFNNLWSVLEVDEVYPQYRSTEHNAIGAYRETTVQYHVDASFLQGTEIENASPGVGQVLRAVEIPDPADTANVGDTIIQWQPGYAASTIPDHRTIPVTTSGADPFDLVDWQLTFGSGDDRVFEALAQTGSTGTIDITLINLGEVLTVTFADGSIEQGHVFGGTTSTTRLFGQLTRRPVSSLLTNNMATATIRYYGDTAAESYVASPLTVNADGEVIYKGNEISTGAPLTENAVNTLIGTVVTGVETSATTGMASLTVKTGQTVGTSLPLPDPVILRSQHITEWPDAAGAPPATLGMIGSRAENDSVASDVKVYHKTGDTGAQSDWTQVFYESGTTAAGGNIIFGGTSVLPTITPTTTGATLQLQGNGAGAVNVTSAGTFSGRTITLDNEGTVTSGGLILNNVATLNGEDIRDRHFRSGGYINAWITNGDPTITAATITIDGLASPSHPIELYNNIQGDDRTWIFIPDVSISGTGQSAVYVTGAGLWTRDRDPNPIAVLAHTSTFRL